VATAGPPIPKGRFTSIDTLALVRELRGHARARIDKVFELGKGTVSITFRRPGSTKRELLIEPGRYAALLGPQTGHEEEPGHLARELRRWLSGTIIQGVEQPGGERFFEAELRRADLPEPLLLSVELFGVGNVVVARGGKLVIVSRPRTWAHRTVRVGAEYERPPSRRDPWTATIAELEATLTASRTDRATTLAARLALGGPLAEELLARAELPGHVPATLDSTEAAERLHAAIAALLEEVGDRPKGFLYQRGDEWLDVEPFVSRRWSNEPEVRSIERPTFSEAAHQYFGSMIPTPVVESSAKEDPLAEIRRQREHQLAAIAGLNDEAQRLITEAERIFAHYSEAEELLVRARRGSGAERIEVVLEGAPTRLYRDRTPRESAQAIYGEAKRVQAKQVGAEAALKDTERRLKEFRIRPLGAAASARIEGPSAARKPLWFQKYRWFVSSENVLVVGGRDASSNDLIVRRYLRPGDFYVHADIHGAPSVVVKHPPTGSDPPTEVTLAEAGQWGVSFSKAWKAGLPSADAFWVMPEQVSKSAPSGEFVARGAWMIHGTKHVLRDLPTELAIGPTFVQGERLWSVAPPSALRVRGEVRFLLTPGEERERLARERDLAGTLGISRDLLQSLLPPGGLTIRRA
jgi:predicted ribosome quality control (RQC) complex YloA/Tae2 family protein